MDKELLAEALDQHEKRLEQQARNEQRYNVGTFHMTRELLYEVGDEDLLKIFSNFIILRAGYEYPGDAIKYTARSPLFLIKVPEGGAIYHYRLEINSDREVSVS